MTATTPQLDRTDPTEGWSDWANPILLIGLVVLSAMMATGTLFAILITSGR